MTQALIPRSADPIILEPDLSRELVNHETLWLRNFISQQTQRAYTRVFRDFCVFLSIDTPDALRAVTAAHIIAYRDYLTETRGDEAPERP